MIIGIFGKIGSGKTTISSKFTNFHPNFKIINADIVAKKCLEQEEVKNKLKKIDENILDNDNNIDRKYLREKIFSNKEFGQKIDDLLWPIISDEINKEISFDPAANYIIEAALLNKLKIPNIDFKVKVKSNLFKIAYRVKKRDGVSLFNIFKIWLKQTKLLKKVKSDITIKYFYELELYIQKNKIIVD
ncbi:dephospho-CoA kinase [Mycoplasma yeatsii]|uniref:dephospho-CoA kinase n=1 Tax=Mycoplasma yeatsii TaxID=51365 RepID=UPI0005B24648|nr:dephospho-CoA kinase [Mycoplasma yeatsii]AJM71738.1 dephospho-CoA kinase [Mycoplasma yeatsii GM274B]